MNAVELLPAKMTIVIDPSGDDRIKRAGNIFDIVSAPPLEFQLPNGAADPLVGPSAQCGRVAGECSNR